MLGRFHTEAQITMFEVAPNARLPSDTKACIQKAHSHSHSTHTLVRGPQVGLKCECEWSVNGV